MINNNYNNNYNYKLRIIINKTKLTILMINNKEFIDHNIILNIKVILKIRLFLKVK